MELKTYVTKMRHQSHPYICNRKQKFSTCPTLDSTPSSEVSSRKLPLIPALSSPKLFTLHRLNDWLQKKNAVAFIPDRCTNRQPPTISNPNPRRKVKEGEGRRGQKGVVSPQIKDLPALPSVPSLVQYPCQARAVPFKLSRRHKSL